MGVLSRKAGRVRRQARPVGISILWKPLRDPHYVVASLQPGGGGLRQIFARQSALSELQALARHAHLSTTMSFYIHLKKAELAAEAISALSLPAPTDPGNGQATAVNATPRHLPRHHVI